MADTTANADGTEAPAQGLLTTEDLQGDAQTPAEPEGKAGETDGADEESLGDPGKKALQQEREARRAAEARVRELEKNLPSDAAQEPQGEPSAEAGAELHETRSQLAAARAELLKYEVASEAGLPMTVASRLRGDTKEALEADAEVLKELLGGAGQTPRAPKPDPSQGVGTGSPRSHADIFADAIGL